MYGKVKKYASILAQLLVIVFTVWSVGSMFLFSGSGNMRVRRWVVFRYFTVDSNILCAVSCGVFLVGMLLGSGKKAVMLLRYAGTAAVTVTMMTVLLFLGPLYGYPAMFDGWNLWLHLLCPLLSLVSFAWLERDGTCPEKKHLIFSLLPVILYGAVYLVMTVFIGQERGGWPDFYAFNMNGTWYLSYLGMLTGTVLIGMLLRLLRKWRSGRAS